MAAPALPASTAALQRDLEEGRLLFDCEVPKDFECSIAYSIMLDPVVASDGHTRASIAE